MPALRLSAVLAAVSLTLLLGACLPNPAPGPGTPILTPATGSTHPINPPATMSPSTQPTLEIVLFRTKWGQIDIGKTAITNGWRDGQLLAPTVNLWDQPDGARSIRCSVSGNGALVRVETLASNRTHARVRSELQPDCYGWLHIDFLAPPDFPLPKL